MIIERSIANMSDYAMAFQERRLLGCFAASLAILSSDPHFLLAARQIQLPGPESWSRSPYAKRDLACGDYSMIDAVDALALWRDLNNRQRVVGQRLLPSTLR